MTRTSFLRQKAALLILCIALMLSLPSCSGTKNSLNKRLNPLQYMRTVEANQAILGSIGNKRSGMDHPFERNRILNWETELKIHNARTLELSENDAKNTGINIEELIQYQGKNDINQKYKLVLLELESPGEVKDQIVRMSKNNPAIFNDIRYGDSRIITAVAAVYNHELADTMSRNYKVILRGKTISFTHSRNKNLEISIEDGSVIAYQYSRFCWDKNGQLKEIIRDREGKDKCRNNWLSIRPKPKNISIVQ